MEYNINVEISDIKVDEKYFSFTYKVTLKTVNGIAFVQHNYSDSHARSKEIGAFTKDLENGYAMQEVLNDVDIFEDLIYKLK